MSGLLPPSDDTASASRLDSLLSRAASASSSRTMTTPAPLAPEAPSSKKTEQRQSKRAVPATLGPTPVHMQERVSLTKNAAAEYHMEIMRKKQESEARATARRREDMARKREDASGWRQAQAAQAAIEAEAEKRREVARQAARREALEDTRARRAAADAAAAQRAAVAAEVEAEAQAAQQREQRAAARVAAAALSKRRAAEEAAMCERQRVEAAAAASNEEAAAREAAAARERQSEWLERYRQRVEVRESEQASAAEMRRIDAEEAAAAAAEKASRRVEQTERWLAAQREKLAAWQDARNELRQGELSEAERRLEEERRDRQARLREWRQLKAQQEAARRHAGLAADDGSVREGDGWGEGSFAAPSLRLTPHELMVTRLADGLMLEDETAGAGGEGHGEDVAIGAEVADVSDTAVQEARYLHSEERSQQAALVSYPRSGNSLLRALLEACSGVLTGSDTPRYAPLSRQLAAFGLDGEGVTDGRVWVVKSHWPERKGCAEVGVHAAVLLVRSPIDAIDSYWHFVLTQTHTDSVKESEYSRLADEWSEHVSREAAVWAAFHQHWLATKTPLLAIRYEVCICRHLPPSPAFSELLTVFPSLLPPSPIFSHLLSPSRTSLGPPRSRQARGDPSARRRLLVCTCRPGRRCCA